jgi:hypothetical protein
MRCWRLHGLSAQAMQLPSFTEPRQYATAPHSAPNAPAAELQLSVFYAEYEPEDDFLLVQGAGRPT